MQKLVLPSHVGCPVCGNETLPPIKLDSRATGRACANCGSVVDRDGVIEFRGTGNKLDKTQILS